LTVEAANPDDAHHRLEKSHNLAASLSQVETRQVRNDYTLKWEGKLYQIERQAGPKCGWRSGWTGQWRYATANDMCKCTTAARPGAAHSTEEAVDKAVRVLHSSAIGKTPVHQQVDNLADLFAKSPFRGLDIDFERDKDTGWDIALYY
jgi:hypothetical protein